MPTKPSVACSLTAADMHQRIAEMAAIGQSGLLAVETKDTRAVLRFRAGAELRQRLERIVAAESQCCAFLSMDLCDQDATLALTIQAPEGAKPVVEDLVAAFSGHERAA